MSNCINLLLRFSLKNVLCQLFAYFFITLKALGIERDSQNFILKCTISVSSSILREFNKNPSVAKFQVVFIFCTNRYFKVNELQNVFYTESKTNITVLNKIMNLALFKIYTDNFFFTDVHCKQKYMNFQF